MMSRRRETSRKAGYLLIEVMVASVAVAVGLAGVMVSFSVLTRTARLMDARTRALHQARQQAELLQRCVYAAPELSLGTHSIAGGAYYVSNYPYASTKLVTVVLNVKAPNNATSQVSVATVLSMALHK
jgi:type II secretory pathway pseudopilin PulG